MKYKVVLDEFVSFNDLEKNFRKWASLKEGVIVFDFHKVKTIDKFTFETILKISKGLKLLGKKVFFCCFTPQLAAITSKWEYDFEVRFSDVL